jgi:hypothetical protein
MRIDVHTSPNVGAGTPVPVEFRRPFEQNALFRAYDISPDGKQFVMVALSDVSTTRGQTQINVVENWLEELKQGVQAK